MIKESHLNIETTIVVLLFSAVYSQKKPDFGSFKACINKNQSLTVDCYYPFCENGPNTPFNCKLYDGEEDPKTLIASSFEAVVNNVSFYATSKKQANSSSRYRCKQDGTGTVNVQI
ncbi:hypothetical protein Q8A67_018394 [Cirrhinus molitorella]|uniref:Uncharacterized protein n=1 Tax=Cirrhinus molitorella TaxID=172907 RepID=A0AA88TEP6_9TELE|nr:hypothetical protein Q8A67_018394 [Cirrhinus molitorella]